MQIVTVKYQSLFSRKNKKNINFSAAELTQRVVKVKKEMMWLITKNKAK